MTLPTFLGLGAMRSGSTWLDQLLRTHPRIYLPGQCKEVHFFDRNYERGVNWYRRFFPSGNKAGAYDHIGEITPKYLYDPEVPPRIEKLLPDCRFLVILRNPADRAYSHYCLLVRDCGVKSSFSKQLDEMPEIVDRGFYARQIKRYFGLFPRERFCFLIFEQAVRSPQDTCRKLAEFLSVSLSQFDFAGGVGSRKVNKSSVPRFRGTYMAGRAVARVLNRCRQGWLVRAAARLGLREFLHAGRPVPPIDPTTRRRLLAQYADDMAELEKLLDVDLSFWRPEAKPRTNAA